MKKPKTGQAGALAIKEPVTEFEESILTACKLRGLTVEEVAVRFGKDTRSVHKALLRLRGKKKINHLQVGKDLRWFSGKTPYIKAITALRNARYTRATRRYTALKIQWSDYTIAAQIKSIAYRDAAAQNDVKVCGGCGMAVAVNVEIAAGLADLAVTMPGYVEAHLGVFSPDAAFHGSYDASWFISRLDGSVGVFCCSDSCRVILELLGPWFWAADRPFAGASTALGAILMRLLEMVVLRDENPKVMLSQGNRRYVLSKTAVNVLTVRGNQVKSIAAAITARATSSMDETRPLQEIE